MLLQPSAVQLRMLSNNDQFPEATPLYNIYNWNWHLKELMLISATHFTKHNLDSYHLLP